MEPTPTSTPPKTQHKLPSHLGIKTRTYKVADLKPHPRNPRHHPEEGSEEWNVLLESMADSYFDPVVLNVRNGLLVSGHLRTKIAKSEEVETIDVVEIDCDEPTHIAKMFAANKSIGRDDETIRKELFIELAKIPNFNFSLTGYTHSESNSILFGEVNPEDLSGRDEQDKKEDRDSTKLNLLIATCQQPSIEVKDGEVYQLGRHFLFCGSLLTTPFENKLVELRAIYMDTDVKVLFVPCPDPYVAINDQPEIVFLMLQPDPYVASHLVTNFFRMYPDTVCLKI